MPLCFWDAYQANPTFENMTKWLKHRAYFACDEIRYFEPPEPWEGGLTDE